MQGLVDNYLIANRPDIGACIYCGERDAPLSTEHAVPYGLNGPWTLLRASCERCAKITTRFERDVMRCLLPHVRNVLAMQTRRRDKRSTALPLEVHRDGVKETLMVPRTKYPTYFPALLFPKPGVFWTDVPVPGVFANVRLLHLAGPTFEEASNEYPGAHFVGARMNFSVEDFARMIAKIGYCAAVASVGLGAFTYTAIRDVILGKDLCINHWVGTWWGEPVNNVVDGLHQIRITHEMPGHRLHAIVRLFAQFGAPEYHVVLGPADPAYVASDQWPKIWADPKNPEDYLRV